MYRIGDIAIYGVPWGLGLLALLLGYAAWRAFAAHQKLWRIPGLAAAMLAPLLMAATYTGLPIVMTNAQLALLPSWQYFAVLRLGVNAVGDAPAQWFVPSATTCSLNAGAGDVGSEVPTVDSGCFNADFPGAGDDIREWGPTLNGTTDDSAAWLAACTALTAQGGGRILMPPKTTAVAQSAILDLTSCTNVSIIGNIAAYGYNANNATAPYTFLVNSAYTVKTGRAVDFYGVRFARYGMSAPTNLANALTEIGNFAGTAITISGLDDVLDHVDINGFAQAVTSNEDRLHLNYVEGDDTAGFLGTSCGDTCTLSHIEWWDFVSSPYNISPQIQTSTVSAFSSGAGGLTEVTLTAAPTYPILTGYTIVIGNSGKLYQQPNGRYIATNIDTTHFLLQGTTYSTQCPSSCAATNEQAILSAGIRTGAAFVLDSVYDVVTGWEYGHDIGLIFGSGSSGSQFANGWIDGDSSDNADPTTIGIVNGAMPGNAAVLTQQNKVTNTQVLDRAISIYNNSSSARPLLVSNSAIAIVGCGSDTLGAGWYDNEGSISLSNDNFEGNPSQCLTSTNSAWAITDAASLVTINGTQYEGSDLIPANVNFQTVSTDCKKVIVDGMIGPCPWTPSLATGGTLTHQAGYPVATYIERNGEITAYWRDRLSANTSPTSSAVTIGGLPAAAANDNMGGGCDFGYTSGVTLTSGYTQMIGVVNFSATSIALDQTGSGQNVAIVPGTGISATAQMQLTCHYYTQIPP